MSIEVLEKCPLFKGVDRDFIKSAFGGHDLHSVKKGEYVFHQGDTGTGMYIVLEGKLDVISENGEDLVVATIQQGSFFGEVCLLTAQKRTAAIKAVENAKLLYIDSKGFHDFLNKKDVNALQVSYNISVTLAHRLAMASTVIQSIKLRSEKEITISEIADYKKRLLSEVLI